jgi:hypothetical protein
MGYPITGATKEAYDKTSIESSGTRPFPFVSGKWTNHTAEVVSVETQSDQSGNGNDQIVIKARNGQHECRLYVSLDPTITGPNCKNVSEQIQKNMDRLLKVGKALDIIGWKGQVAEIEPRFFVKAEGKIIEIGIQGAVNPDGSPKMNQKGYQTINTSFSGIAKALLPVVEPVGTVSGSTAKPSYADDIPF